jgi:hypothetical protein
MGIRNVILRPRTRKFYTMRGIGMKFVKDTEPTNDHVGITGSIQSIFFILLWSLSATTFVFVTEVVIKTYLQKVFIETRKACHNLYILYANSLKYL